MTKLALSIPAVYAAAAALCALAPGWPQKRKRLAVLCAAGLTAGLSLLLLKAAVSGGPSDGGMLPLKISFPWLDGALLRVGPLFYADGMTVAALCALCALNLAGALHAVSRSSADGAPPPQASALAMGLLCAAAMSGSLPWALAFLCCADACAFPSPDRKPLRAAALLLPYLPAALGALALASSAGTFSIPMLDVQRDSAFLPRAALDLPAGLLAAGAAARLFAPPFSGLARELAKRDFSSSLTTLCAAPLAWFLLLARLEPALGPALDSRLLGWAGLAAAWALALRAMLASDAADAAACAAGFVWACALALAGERCFLPGALLAFALAPAAALLLASADSVGKSFGSSSFDRLGRARFAMPITHIAVMLAALSFAGLPPLGGFFALKAALGGLYAMHRNIETALLAAAFAVAGAAAVRSFHMVFNGEAHTSPDKAAEAPVPELASLILLACGAVFGGWLLSRRAVLPQMLPLPPAPREPLLSGLAAAALASGAVLAEIFYQTRCRWERKTARRKPAEALAWLLELRPVALAFWLLGVLSLKLAGALSGGKESA